MFSLYTTDNPTQKEGLYFVVWELTDTTIYDEDFRLPLLTPPTMDVIDPVFCS